MSIQRLLIGTHASSGEQNYLQIMKVKMPLEKSNDVHDQDEQSEEQALQNSPIG